MESDGPYKLVGGVFEGPNGFNFRIVWGPDFKLDDKIILEEIIKVANQSYAEGRKAAEKEFKELLGLANMLESLLVSRAFGGRFTGDDVSNGDREKFWLRSRIGLFSEWKHERGLR